YSLSLLNTLKKSNTLTVLDVISPAKKLAIGIGNIFTQVLPAECFYRGSNPNISLDSRLKHAGIKDFEEPQNASSRKFNLLRLRYSNPNRRKRPLYLTLQSPGSLQHFTNLF